MSGGGLGNGDESGRKDRRSRKGLFIAAKIFTTNSAREYYPLPAMKISRPRLHASSPFLSLPASCLARMGCFCPR